MGYKSGIRQTSPSQDRFESSYQVQFHPFRSHKQANRHSRINFHSRPCNLPVSERVGFDPITKPPIALQKSPFYFQSRVNSSFDKINRYKRFYDWNEMSAQELTSEYMFSVKGRIVTGVKDFQRRMTRFPEVFKKATGQELYPGTLNVKIEREIKIQEDIRILGAEIDEPGQDLLFENCLISGIKAYRIRPFVVETGGGGHGDDTL